MTRAPRLALLVLLVALSLPRGGEGAPMLALDEHHHLVRRVGLNSTQPYGVGWERVQPQGNNAPAVLSGVVVGCDGTVWGLHDGRVFVGELSEGGDVAWQLAMPCGDERVDQLFATPSAIAAISSTSTPLLPSSASCQSPPPTPSPLPFPAVSLAPVLSLSPVVPAPPAAPASLTQCASGALWAVSHDGAVMTLPPDGAWSAVPLPAARADGDADGVGAGMRGVWCVAKGVWGLDRGGSVWFRQGERDGVLRIWEEVATDVKDLSASAAGGVVAVTANNTLLARAHIDPLVHPFGTAWEVLSSPDASVSSLSHCFPPYAPTMSPLSPPAPSRPFHAPLALEPGWFASGQASVSGQGRLCVLSGRLHAGTTPWSRDITRLPSPCRPASPAVLLASNLDAVVEIEIGEDGRVRVGAGEQRHGWLSLDGLAFASLQTESNEESAAGLSMLDWQSAQGASVGLVKEGAVCALRGTAVVPDTASTAPPQHFSGGETKHEAAILRITDPSCLPPTALSFAVAGNIGSYHNLQLATDGVLSLTNSSAGAAPKWVDLNGVLFAVGGGHSVSLAEPWEGTGGVGGGVRVVKVGDLCVVSGEVEAKGEVRSALATLPSFCSPPHPLTLHVHLPSQIAPGIAPLSVSPSGRVALPQSLPAFLPSTPRVLALGPLVFDTRPGWEQEGVTKEEGEEGEEEEEEEEEEERLGEQWVVQALGGWDLGGKREGEDSARGAVVDLSAFGVCLASGDLTGSLSLCDQPLALLEPECRPSVPVSLLAAPLSPIPPLSLSLSPDGRLRCSANTTTAHAPGAITLSLGSVVFSPSFPNTPVQVVGPARSGEQFAVGATHAAHVCVLSGQLDIGAHTDAMPTHPDEPFVPKHVANVAIACHPSSPVYILRSGNALELRTDGKLMLHVPQQLKQRGRPIVELGGITFSRTVGDSLELVGSPAWQPLPDHTPPHVVAEAGVCVLGGVCAGGAMRGPIAKLPSSCTPESTLSFVVGLRDADSQRASEGVVDARADGTLSLRSSPFKNTLVTLTGIAYAPTTSAAVRKAMATAHTTPRIIGTTSAMFGEEGVVEVEVGRVGESFTAEAWVFAEDVPGTHATILSAPGILSLSLLPSSPSPSPSQPSPSFALRVGDDAAHLTNASLSHRQWHHVAIHASPSALVVTLDGRDVGTFPRHSPLSCARDNARDYRGPVSTTSTGRACQLWASQAPHTHEYTGDVAIAEGLEGRACRNPKGEKGGAWCFNGEGDEPEWELCDVPVCGGQATTRLAVGGGFVGRIAEVRVWGVEHTSTKIRSLMHSRSSSPSMLVNLQFGGAGDLNLALDHTAKHPTGTVEGDVQWVREGPQLKEVLTEGGLLGSTSVDTHNGRVRVSHSPAIAFQNTEPMTLEMWVMADTDAPPGSWIALKNGAYGIEWQGKDAPLLFFDGNFHSGFKSDFTERHWFHVALVDSGQEGGTLSLFVDGQLDAVEPRRPNRLGSSPLSLGGLSSSFFQGSIADVRVWRVALPPATIAANMHFRLRGNEPGLSCYLRFDGDASVGTDAVTGDPNAAAPVANLRWVPSGPALDSAWVRAGHTAADPHAGKVMRFRDTHEVVPAVVRRVLANGEEEVVAEEAVHGGRGSNSTHRGPTGPQCPAQCSGRGVCREEGVCQCEAGYSGEDCGEGCPRWCNDHGKCVDGTCFCDAGYRGRDCSERRAQGWNAPNDQCTSLPPNLPHFCAMITHSVPLDMRKRVHEVDEEAQDVYRRLSPYCAHPRGRQLMKEAICASFFLECSADGSTVGVCESTCQRYSKLCRLDAAACAQSMYVADGTAECRVVEERDEVCARDCSGHGSCEKGECTCKADYAEADCSTYDGDTCTKSAEGRAFCDMVDYAVPAALNPYWADNTAKRAFDILKEFCPNNPKALTAMHHTLCATGFVKCQDGRVQKPCRSMCEDYASQCGISNGLSCFSDFYGDAPNCFTLPYAQRLPSPLASPSLDPHALARLRQQHFTCPDNFTCVHGSCIDGSCSCLRGYYSHDCSVEIPTCEGYCSGHGVCQDQRCKCLPGWEGDSCDMPTSLCDFDCEADGWRVESCCASMHTLLHPTERAASIVSHGCECSGHGACINNRTCACDPGWHGHNCSLPNACDNACSGHGECVEPPPLPFFPPGQPHDADEAGGDGARSIPEERASGHSEPEMGWPKVQVLNQTYTSSPYFPKHHAPFVAPASNATNATRARVYPQWIPQAPYCRCHPAFTGPACAEPVTRASMCPRSCSGRGVCIAAPRPHFNASRVAANATRMLYRCVCDDGYDGEDCSMEVPCPNNCSGKGRCSRGECHCDAFRSGVDCSVVLPQCGVHFKCLNLGVCDESGTACVCPRFYFGSDCSQRISNPTCPNDYQCENRGKCVDGKCMCAVGYKGFDCNGSVTFDAVEHEHGGRKRLARGAEEEELTGVLPPAHRAPRAVKTASPMGLK